MDLHALVSDPVPYLDSGDASVRRLAISACSGRVTEPIAALLMQVLERDPEARVRAEAAEILAELGSAAIDPLMAAKADPDGLVREAVATGFGEIEDRSAVPWLLAAAAADPEKLVREAAVAALGAIGDDTAVPLLLVLVATAPPQVRRRCVVALSVFDGPEIEAAVRAARDDRNPMVREADEMVIGH